VKIRIRLLVLSVCCLAIQASADIQHRAQAKGMIDAYVESQGGKDAALANPPPNLEELVQTCGVCHGKDGNSTHANIPSLAAQNPRYIVEQILAFQDRQRASNIMHLNAKQIAAASMPALALYFSNLPRRVTTKVDEDKAKAGEQLYQALCANCHGTDGTGSNETYANIRAQRTDYLISTLRRFQGSGIQRHSHEMSIATRGLTDAEIQSLAHYIAGF